jgi:hypothetical protein
MASQKMQNQSQMVQMQLLLQDMRETPMEKMAKLQKRKEELILRVLAIDSALADDAIPINYGLNSVVPRSGIHAKRTTQTNPSSGIRINNKLSFRGKQKAGEYFERLDEDGDGYLTFDDFRAMISLTDPNGLVSDSVKTTNNSSSSSSAGGYRDSNHHYRDWEAWRMYMDDLGVKTDQFGRIDKAGFVKYRGVVELDMPLSRELEKLSVDLLPRDLSLWKRLKELIHDVYLHKKLTHTDMLHEFDPALHLEDVAFVLGNLGYVYTREEFIDCMKIIAPFQLCMHELLRVSFHKYYATSNDVFKNHGTDDFKEKLVIRIKNLIYIPPHVLAGWVFGRRVEPKPMDLYRQLIHLKQTALYYWRKIDFVTRVMFEAGMQIRLRMVYRHMKPMEKIITKEEKTFSNIGCMIGSRNNQVNDGIGIHWNISKLNNPEEHFAKYKLPKDTGTSFSIELALRSETTPIQAKRAAEALVLLLRSHFEDELKKNAQYRGLSVFPAENEADGAQVLRVSIAFKRIVSIDAYFEYCFIPYSLYELFPDFGGSFRTSINLYDILHAQTVSLDTSFTCQILVRLTYVRRELLSVLQRTILALSSSIFNAEIVPPDDPEDRREVRLWDKIKPYFGPIVDTCKFLHSTLKGMKNTKVNYKFKTISEFVSLMRMDNLWLTKFIPLSINLPDLGVYLHNKFYEWKKSFSEDLEKQYVRLKKIMEDKVIAQELERTRLLMGLISHPQSEDSVISAGMQAKADLLAKLEELGIQAGAAELIDEESEDYAPLFREWKAINQDRDVHAFIAYERLWHACSGLHSFEVVTGKARIAANCQGLEIFDLLPVPPSLHAVKEACDKKSRRHHQKAK